ncbi:MAG: SusC/RagA family protein, partial [Sphingobacteriaceae bacterium]
MTCIVRKRLTNLTWNVGFNAAYNKRKITKLTVQNDPAFIGIPVGEISGGTNSQIQITAVNNQPNSFFVYKQVYDKNNKPVEGLYTDLNGDGVINEQDLYISNRNPYPVVSVGFNTSLGYRKWTVSTSLHGNIGNYVYNNTASSSGYTDALFNNTGATLQNVSTGIYSTLFKTRQLFSDYYLENASFIRMDNATLSYNAGKILRDKVGLLIS